MTRPEEHAYSSHISYCRAMEAYCDKIEAELAELEAQEPVAWTWVDRKGWKEYSDTPHDTYTCTPLYKRNTS